jgi:hypothetical protein
MHYLSSVYSVTVALHVSDLLVAHRQEVTTCIWDSWYVLYVLVDCRWDRPQSTVYDLSFTHVNYFSEYCIDLSRSVTPYYLRNCK